MNELLQMMQSFCKKLLQQKQAASIDQSPLQEMSIQDMEDLKQHYLDEMLSLNNDLQINDYRNEKIDIRFRRECESMIDELKGKFNGMSIEINKKKELQHLEQVANLSTYPSQRFKSFCYYVDDDYDYEKSIIPLNAIDSQIPPSNAITPVLPTIEPEDSLKSEDLTDYESECDMPVCDDSSSKNDGLDDIISIPLGKEIDHLDAIPDSDSDSLMEEINIFLTPNDSILPGIENDDYDSEGDVLFLKELLNDDSISRPEYESFHIDFYNVPSSPRPPEKPPDEDVYFDIDPDTRVLTTKVVDDIFDNSTRELYVHVPNVLPTLPTLYPVFDTLLPFSSKLDFSDYEDSRARSFVHRSLDLRSLACL
ncbi:hypothetical protein Tco_0385441 [Tanacetum coccineum]